MKLLGLLLACPSPQADRAATLLCCDVAPSLLFLRAEQGGYIAWYEIKDKIAKGAKVGGRGLRMGQGQQQLQQQRMLQRCTLHAISPKQAHACSAPLPFLQVVIDQTAKAAYVVDGTNWIGTDVPETFNMKIEAARQRGLGGLMVRWWRVCGRPWHSGT